MECLLCSGRSGSPTEDNFNLVNQSSSGSSGANCPPTARPHINSFSEIDPFLTGRKLTESLCQLLGLPATPFHQHFAQSNIGFCTSCTHILSTVNFLLSHLQQLQQQLAASKDFVTQCLSRVVNNGTHGNSSDNQNNFTDADAETLRTLRRTILRAAATSSPSRSPSSSRLPNERQEEQLPVVEILPTGTGSAGASDEDAEAAIAITVKTEVEDFSDLLDVAYDHQVELESPSPRSSKRKHHSLQQQRDQVDDVGQDNDPDYDDDVQNEEDDAQSEDEEDEDASVAVVIASTKRSSRARGQPKRIQTKSRSRQPPKEVEEPRRRPCCFPNCDETFTTAKARRTHLDQVHDARPSHWKCPADACPRICVGEHEFVSHFRIHSGERPFLCPECDKGFRHSNFLNKHLATHRDERPFKCPKCPRAFKTSGNLKCHVGRVHVRVEQFQCQICTSGSGFITKRELECHQAKAHSLGPSLDKLKCRFCAKIFASESYRLRHEKTHAEAEASASASHFRFQCHVCLFRTDIKDTLAQHVRTHSDEREFECDQCSKTFKYKVTLLRHFRKQHGSNSDVTGTERPFKCSECPKDFKGAGACRKHKVTNTQRSSEKPFKCPRGQCGAAFPNQECLRIHLLTHRNRKLKIGDDKEKDNDKEPKMKKTRRAWTVKVTKGV